MNNHDNTETPCTGEGYNSAGGAHCSASPCKSDLCRQGLAFRVEARAEGENPGRINAHCTPCLEDDCEAPAGHGTCAKCDTHTVEYAPISDQRPNDPALADYCRAVRYRKPEIVPVPYDDFSAYMRAWECERGGTPFWYHAAYTPGYCPDCGRPIAAPELNTEEGDQ